MAFVAGQLVIPKNPVTTFGQMAPIFGGGGMPLKGVVESVSGNNVKVDWEDGSVVTYADGGGGLYRIAAAGDPTLYHKLVTLTALPAPYGASNGLVIALFKLDPAGLNLDIAAVRWENGDVGLFTVALLALIDVNPNVTS